MILILSISGVLSRVLGRASWKEFLECAWKAENTTTWRERPPSRELSMHKNKERKERVGSCASCRESGTFGQNQAPLEKVGPGMLGRIATLAPRNRSDFCDLRLRCPSRTPEIQVLSEYVFAYGSKTETRQFSTNFSCEPHGEGKETCLCPSTDRVRFRLFPSTVWAGREYGLDWFRVRFRYPLR